MSTRIFVSFSLLLIISMTVSGQIRSLGLVNDPNGAAIVGATIVSTCPGEPTETVQTDSNGRFSVRFKPGCTLKISARGFAEWTGDSIYPHTVPMFVLEIEPTKLTVAAETGRTENRENVPQAVTVIPLEKLQDKAPTVLAQVADEEVGVSLQRTSPTIGAISVRGLTGKNVSLYIDGVRFTNSAQRGGISTFFNLNDAAGLQSVEILRGASSAQYGSDSLGGSVNLITRSPSIYGSGNEIHGEFSVGGAYTDLSHNSSGLLSFGNNFFGGSLNLSLRRASTFRPAGGVDTHAAVTRFLGLSSDIYGGRLPDTAFTQYGGALKLNYSPTTDRMFIIRAQRSQQDGGKRWDQLGGGDGNLIADLRNLMGDFGYLRFVNNGLGWFDSGTFTLSYNSQREERVNQGGQGNPLGTIIHQYERTSVTGGSFFLEKNFGKSNDLLIGGDYYFEKINAPAFTLNPVDSSVVLSRPRVPDEARFITNGIYVQDSWSLVQNRLRFSGALRYNYGSYRSFGSASPIVNGRPLWSDDAISFDDVSGRIGIVGRPAKELSIAFNYSRGFRYPGMTDLGTLGLTGDGYETDYASAFALGGLIGNSASATAISTGIPVSKQKSEYTNTYDLSVRYSHKRFDTDLTYFFTQFRNTITKQTLILPAGSIGKLLGDQPIVSQNSNGAVFVALSTAPVLVRTNYTSARIYGFEYEFEAKVTDRLNLRGNYTFIHAADPVTGLPPNIEGGTPPPQGMLSLRYQMNSRIWLEAFSTLAGRQSRLSSLDLSDRRTGAVRSRLQIQNFFRRGACVLGLTNNPDGRCGTGDETILLLTNESVLQVQNRVLGLGNDNVPMFAYLPGFALVNLRGGIKLNEQSRIFWSLENALDQYNRKPSWGMDGSGRNLKLQYSVRF